MSKPCPCHSGLPYKTCCQPLHLGKPASNAEELMRSRYTAYALNLPDYIIKTTHPDNPAYLSDHKKWSSELLTFSETTQFLGLEILDSHEDDHEASVTFKAILKQNGQDASFTEKSRFLKENSHWLYFSGVISH